MIDTVDAQIAAIEARFDACINLTLILGLILTSLMILTPIAYRLFLEKRIKDKKAVLSFLRPAFLIVIYTILYCALVNVVIVLTLEFCTTVEWGAMSNVMIQTPFIAYMALLPIPRMLIFCFQISVKKEENGGNITFLEGLKLFWRKSQKEQ